MRNASDIFCLNEDLTDGRQIFSINGYSPMKLKRRPRSSQSNGFVYGSSKPINNFEVGDKVMEKQDLEKLNGSDEGTEQDVDVVDNFNELNLKEDIDEMDELSARHEMGDETIVQSSRSVPITPIDTREFNIISGRSTASTVRKSINSGKKQSSRGKPSTSSEGVLCSTSSMLRNPITGVGMETTKYRKAKKGMGSKNQKWVW
ncbi:uncharacterized protein LOC114331045 [Diabrotica virgifera virgifera]|uniref:Uncharacterized protein n=1 Tax=Diabrotica virgifera virgifera TaxID=50390 RepID=A0ABM5IM97_DIAVI|nr:uncharacterized protein LOC114331045 [Diabrotica virgifera virgifera]